MKKCGEFNVNEDAIEGFINPEVVAFGEIRTSPKKRRVSVSGVVKESKYEYLNSNVNWLYFEFIVEL